jgi:hypothetical protein
MADALLDRFLTETVIDPKTNIDKFKPTARYYIKVDMRNAYNSVNRPQLMGLLEGI